MVFSRILEQYGLAEEETERNKPDIDDCPQCQTTLRGSPRFCPGCGLAPGRSCALAISGQKRPARTVSSHDGHKSGHEKAN